MRTFSFISALVVTLTAVFPVGDAQAQQFTAVTTGGQRNNSVEIIGRAYDRPGPNSEFPVFTSPNTGTAIFTSQDALDLNGALGLEVRYGFQTPGGRNLEFRSIVANFETEATISTLGGVISPVIPGLSAPFVNYEYESQLLSFELLSRRQLTSGMAFTFGPRFISLSDEATFSNDAVIDLGGGPFGGTAENEVNTNNNLIGFQSGLEFDIPVSRSIRTETYIRAGGFFNPTESIDIDRSSLALFPLAETTTRTTSDIVSFVGEVGGRVVFDIIPDSLVGFLGYEATWIDGVALAPEQIILNPSSTVNTANTLFLQSVVFGVRMEF